MINFYILGLPAWRGIYGMFNAEGLASLAARLRREVSGVGRCMRGKPACAVLEPI